MTSVKAATDEAGEIEKERTLLRSTIAIAQAEDTNGQVTRTAIQTLLNNRNTTTTVTQETSTTLKVTFSESARSYIIDMNVGLAYSVAFDANGGTGGPATQYATQGKATKISKTEPTREGYDFLGWATSSTATEVQYVVGAKFTPATNTTLYAVWSDSRPIYTITFDADGGTGGPTSLSGREGETVTIPEDIPTRDEYIFRGWEDRSTPRPWVKYYPGDTITLTTNLTLTAKWGGDAETGGGDTPEIPTPSYTITLDPNGGVLLVNALTSLSGLEGETVTIPEDIPIRTGYTFNGWQAPASTSSGMIVLGEIYNPGDEIILTQNLTLTAKWTINGGGGFTPIDPVDPTESYTITFNANGGYFGSILATTKTIRVTPGDAIGTVTVPTKFSSTFSMWKDDATGTTYSSITIQSVVPTKDMTFTAVWVSGGQTMKLDDYNNLKTLPQTADIMLKTPAIPYKPIWMW